jgi:hypothetical protein
MAEDEKGVINTGFRNIFHIDFYSYTVSVYQQHISSG